jgi:hypothetical protein
MLEMPVALDMLLLRPASNFAILLRLGAYHLG